MFSCHQLRAKDPFTLFVLTNGFCKQYEARNDTSMNVPRISTYNQLKVLLVQTVFKGIFTLQITSHEL